MSMDNTNNIITTNITEKELHPVTGMLMLIINIVGVLFSMLLCVISPLLFYGAAGGLGVVIGVLLLVLFCIMFAGLKVCREDMVATADIVCNCPGNFIAVWLIGVFIKHVR